MALYALSLCFLARGLAAGSVLQLLVLNAVVSPLQLRDT